MSWAAVRAWRDLLADDIDAAPHAGLSTAGRRLAVTLALDALHDEALAAVAAMPGEPFDRATLVTARTVATAALEWLAVLLGRGTAVTWKVPREAPGLSGWIAGHAQQVGLPLVVTPERAAVSDTPLVVVMGDDATVAAVRAAARPDARVLGFGHRFSLAWVDADLDPVTAAEALARDVAAHDTRGCLAPAVVLTPAPERLLGPLSSAMDTAQARWPRGELWPAEHAALRARDLLARATGQLVAGEGWRVHVLPPDQADPVARPRAVQLVALPDVDAARSWLAPWRDVLSTVASGLPPGAPSVALDAPRRCRLGELQAPPLQRWHDGVDHLRLTLRAG
ncbi:MAG: hypothetical protein H6732_09270 [Alphaproteobacteria bacterium]|nr:hypothetical protein [Alphaproteobacteria bacterium]